MAAVAEVYMAAREHLVLEDGQLSVWVQSSQCSYSAVFISILPLSPLCLMACLSLTAQTVKADGKWSQLI